MIRHEFGIDPEWTEMNPERSGMSSEWIRNGSIIDPESIRNGSIMDPEWVRHLKKLRKRKNFQQYQDFSPQTDPVSILDPKVPRGVKLFRYFFDVLHSFQQIHFANRNEQIPCKIPKFQRRNFFQNFGDRSEPVETEIQIN